MFHLNIYFWLQVYRPTSPGSSSLFSANENVLITDKKKVFERWAEHFNCVFKHPSTINEKEIARLLQVPIKHSLADVPEVEKAVKWLSSRKTPGSDSIFAEIFAFSGPIMNRKLSELFHCMWNQELFSARAERCFYSLPIQEQGKSSDMRQPS